MAASDLKKLIGDADINQHVSFRWWENNLGGKITISFDRTARRATYRSLKDIKRAIAQNVAQEVSEQVLGETLIEGAAT